MLITTIDCGETNAILCLMYFVPLPINGNMFCSWLLDARFLADVGILR